MLVVGRWLLVGCLVVVGLLVVVWCLLLVGVDDINNNTNNSNMWGLVCLM